MNQNSDSQPSSDPSDDRIEELVDLAIGAVRQPTAEFTVQLTEIINTVSREAGLKLCIDQKRVAQEIARTVVLDLVQSGIRDLTRAGGVKSNVVMEIYNHACALSDEAVNESLRETRLSPPQDWKFGT